jgi:hypothetical protein
MHFLIVVFFTHPPTHPYPSTHPFFVLLPLPHRRSNADKKRRKRTKRTKQRDFEDSRVLLDDYDEMALDDAVLVSEVTELNMKSDIEDAM